MQMLNKMDTMQRSPSPAAKNEIIAMHDDDEEEHDLPGSKSGESLDLYDMDWSGVAAQHGQNSNNLEVEVKTIPDRISEPLVYDVEASGSPMSRKSSGSGSPGNKTK